VEDAELLDGEDTMAVSPSRSLAAGVLAATSARVVTADNASKGCHEGEGPIAAIVGVVL